MDLLITGSSGFVGQNLKDYIKNDYSFNCPDRKTLNADLSSILVNSKTIIHLAGKAHDLKKTSAPDEYYEVNYELTKKLYDAFLNSNAEKFIFMSSVKAAADQINGTLTEQAIANPQTDYGKSKLLAEQYIQSQRLPEGKSYFILRPCMIHGSGNKGNLNLLFKVVKKGIPYPLAAFNNKRSFLSIENLCFVIKELIDRNDISSGVYQLADDESLSISEVVTILAASLKKQPRLWPISPKLINFFAKLGDVFRLPLTTERLSKLTENYVVSNEKITKALGKELPLRAKQGLQVTASSFGSQ